MINIQLVIQCDRCHNAEIEYEAVTPAQAADPTEMLADDEWLVSENGHGDKHYCPWCRNQVEAERARVAADDYQVDAATQAEVDRPSH